METDLATFDSDLQGFQINSYNNPGEVNLGTSTTNPASLLWDSVEGSPAAGSLQVTIPFTDYNQYVSIVRNLPQTELQDWSGQTLHVRVRIATGGNPVGTPMATQVWEDAYLQATEGGADAYVFAGHFSYAAMSAGWQDFTFNAANAMIQPGWDGTKIWQFGVTIYSTTPNPSPVAKPTPAVVYIDSFSLVGVE